MSSFLNTFKNRVYGYTELISEQNTKSFNMRIEVDVEGAGVAKYEESSFYKYAAHSMIHETALK